jgi:protoporphyrinogen oxidase
VHIDLLVIGAGPTGIGAAARAAERGLDYLVVERETSVGGAASSFHDDQGFTWDIGGHVLHNHFQSFADAIEVSGVELLDIERNGQVWIGGRFVPTPIQQQLEALPTDTDPEADVDDLLAYYRTRFGHALTERFFRPFTEKMWAYPLDGLDHEWTSLRSGSGKANVPELRIATPDRPKTVRETFPYPKGGTGALWQGIADALLDPARLRLGVAVVELDAENRVATLEDGTTIEYDQCVTTAPLPSVMRWAGIPAEPSFVSSTVHAVGLGFEGEIPEALADKTYMSSPDENVPWYRLTVLSNYDQDNAGEGRWSVLCETSTSTWRHVTAEEALEGTRRSLEGFGADLSKVASTWTRLIPMGYPLPVLGRDDALHRVDDQLIGLGIRARGRFGGWRYESCNQDYSYAQGQQAVDAFLDGSGESVYWNPEMF